MKVLLFIVRSKTQHTLTKHSFSQEILVEGFGSINKGAHNKPLAKILLRLSRTFPLFLNIPCSTFRDRFIHMCKAGCKEISVHTPSEQIHPLKKPKKLNLLDFRKRKPLALFDKKVYQVLNSLCLNFFQFCILKIRLLPITMRNFRSWPSFRKSTD